MSTSDSAFLALMSQSSGQYGQPMVMKLQDFYDPFAEEEPIGFNTPQHHPHQLHAVPGSPGGSSSNVVVKMEDLTTGLTMESFGNVAGSTAPANSYDMYNNHGAFVHSYAGYNDEGEEEEGELEGELEDEEEGIVSGVQDGEEDEEGEEERDTTKDSDYTPAAHGRVSGRSSATTNAAGNGGALRRKSARKVRKTIKYEDVGSEGGSDNGYGYGYSYGVSGESPIVLNLAQQPLISAADVPCNNKKALDQSWPRELLDMPIPDLNRYIKHNRLSEAQVKALKEARRRKKNRLYAQRSRTKKQTQGEQLESAEQAARDLQAELRRMHDIVARRDKEIAALRSVLKAHNIKA